MWPIMPWTLDVTLGGPSPLGLSFPGGGGGSLWLEEEWVGKPCQCLWLCQVLSSSPALGALVVCGRVRGGDQSWRQMGDRHTVPTDAGNPEGHTQARRSGPAPPNQGTEWGLAQEAARVQSRPSGNARRLGR